MTETEFSKANKKYLDIAKVLTDDLYRICIDTKEEYTGLEIINGISTGVYMFFKAISKDLQTSPLDLYEVFDRWFRNMDSLMEEHEVQTQKGVSGGEAEVVGETTSEL